MLLRRFSSASSARCDLAGDTFVSLGRKLLIASPHFWRYAGFRRWNLVLYPWSPDSRMDATRPPDGIVVLGGSIDADLSVARGTAAVTAAAGRLIEGPTCASVSERARHFFRREPELGIADAREAITPSPCSKVSGLQRAPCDGAPLAQHAGKCEFSKIAAPKSGERWLLVTSAYHMPRSPLVSQAGFAVEPIRSTGVRASLRISCRSRPALVKAGSHGYRRPRMDSLAAYWLTGKIDDVLPGPVRN